MRIAIASGKGGTGKTTISTNLAYVLANNFGENVALVDCDVEEPNGALFFENKEVVDQQVVFKNIPSIDKNRCTFCKKCVAYCEFNAITIVPKLKFIDIHESLCHSCGACTYACEAGAISEIEDEIGVVRRYDTHQGFDLTEGRLRVGSPMQTMLISKLKDRAKGKEGITLFDAPPGTSCPMVETVSDMDYVILVAEPTPFGLYDLTLAVDLLKQIEKPFGVVVNKAGMGNRALYDYLSEEQIEILGEIPFSRAYASLYAKGDLWNEAFDMMRDDYCMIIEKLLKLCSN